MRWALNLTQWVLRGVVAAWIVVVLIGLCLHFLIVPRLDDLRPWLLAQLSQRIGIAVEVDAMEAYSNGLLPTFELRGVRLRDQDGDVVLVFPKVLVAVSPQSLLRGDVEQLYFESPAITVERNLEGNWHVAGLALGANAPSNHAGIDWLLGQKEVVVRHGALTWIDELTPGLSQSNAPATAVDFADVNVVIRNGARSHAIRIDATPPAAWGVRWNAMGQFSRPLWSTHASRWSDWSGTVYAEMPYADLAAMAVNTKGLGGVLAGTGAARTWVDIVAGKFNTLTTDIDLRQVQARVGTQQKTVAVNKVAGRLGFGTLTGGTHYFAKDMALDTEDGVHWPGGKLQAWLWDATAKAPAHGKLEADHLDLGALTQLAARMPIPMAAHDALVKLDPGGRLDAMVADWTGPINAPLDYRIKGQWRNAELAPYPRVTMPSLGFEGVDVAFEANSRGGTLKLGTQKGVLLTRHLFEEARIPLDTLQGELRWDWKQGSLAGEQFLRIQIPGLRFANDDAAGELSMHWEDTHPWGTPLPEYPLRAKDGSLIYNYGHLDLQGTLSRAKPARVARYLPVQIDKASRDYVQGALLDGEASNLRFKVLGDLDHFPFAHANPNDSLGAKNKSPSTQHNGEFLVQAKLRNVTYAYWPSAPNKTSATQTLARTPAAALSPAAPTTTKIWPTFTQLQGGFSLNRDTMTFDNVQGLWSKPKVNNQTTALALPINKGSAKVERLYGDVMVSANLEGRTPVEDLLLAVNNSPLSDLTGSGLAATKGTGNTNYRVNMSIPVNHLNRTSVQGALSFAGNSIQLTPSSPVLSRLRGTLNFSETGISMAGLLANAVGGEARFDGALHFGAWANAANNTLRVQGQLSGSGMAQEAGQQRSASINNLISGQTPYAATLSWVRGSLDLAASSSLQGLAIALPAPLGKNASSVLPVRITQTGAGTDAAKPSHATQQTLVEWGPKARLQIQSDREGLQRGVISIGNETTKLQMPKQGMALEVVLDRLDADEWLKTLESAGIDLQTGGPDGAWQPNTVKLQVGEFHMLGRKLSGLGLIATKESSREGGFWKAQIEASQLAGSMEYRPTKLYARLTRLNLEAGSAQAVENLLDSQPSSLPAMDVVVDDFELYGKKLGRLELEAINEQGAVNAAAVKSTAREWRLQRLRLSNPDATLNATGSWALNTVAAAGLRPLERRRTQLQVKLDLANAGDLLARFGMKEVVRKGSGKLEGNIGWMSSPFQLDYPSLTGKLTLAVEDGAFLKADPGIAKLLGVLSLQSLPRRLLLDFRDVFSEGFAFDYVRGDVAIDQGIARTQNLQMKGVTATVVMEGSTDLAKETQSLKALVVPEINAGSASLLTAAVNPLVGAYTFLVQLLLRQPLIDAATQEFLIEGTWLEPRVTKLERRSAK